MASTPTPRQPHPRSYLAWMRLVFAVAVCGFALCPSQGNTQASSSDEITRALGGDSWKPRGQRSSELNKTVTPQRSTEKQDLHSETPFPNYDVEAACRKGGWKDGNSLSACVEFVQPYYNALKREWPLVSEEARKRCSDKFQNNIHARYVQIESCISYELQTQDAARKQEEPTRFRY